MVTNLAFVNQAAIDWFLLTNQQLDRFKSKNLSELVAIATKVYNNRGVPKVRQTQALPIMTAGRSQWSQISNKLRDNERPECPHLKRNQCAYCKKGGAWKRDCPQKRKEQKDPKITKRFLK